jgi:lipopolysaccharide export system permease protein
LKEIITKGTSIDTTLQIVPNDFIIAKTDTANDDFASTTQLHPESKGTGIWKYTGIPDRVSLTDSLCILGIYPHIIGAAISARKVKGEMGLNIGIGLALSMAYILFMTVSSTFAVKGGMSPFIAAWIPNIIFTGIALYLYKRAPN